MGRFFLLGALALNAVAACELRVVSGASGGASPSEDPQGRRQEDDLSRPVDGGVACVPAWRVLARSSRSRPSARTGASAAYDAATGHVLVFGGRDAGHRHLADLWRLDARERSPLDAWERIDAEGTPPAPRASAAAFFDAERREWIVHGGEDASGSLGDASVLRLGGAPRWAPLSPRGAPPVARSHHTLTWDPARGRAILFGGLTRGGARAAAAELLRNDTWWLERDGEGWRWRALAPASPPSPRAAHAAATDHEGRTFVMGGATSAEELLPLALSDHYWLDEMGAAFAPLDVEPPLAEPRSFAQATFDASERRVLLFGGRGNHTGVDQAVVMTLAVGALPWRGFTELGVAGVTTLQRFGHAMVHDVDTHRLITFGGRIGNQAGLPVSDEARALSLECR